MKRKTIIVACTVVICALVLIDVIPFRYKRTIDALEIDLTDEEYCITRSIDIDGYCHVNYLRKSYFTGKITVEGYPVTERMLESPVEFSGENADILYKISPDGNRLYFGIIFSNLDMNRLVILLSDTATTGDDTGGGVTIAENEGRYIVASADSRDKAATRVYSIIKKYIN